VDQAQPLLDLLQAPRVELDGIAIAGQLARQVIEQRGHFAQLLAQRDGLRVDACESADGLLRRADRVERARLFVVAAGEQQRGLVAQAGKLLRVGEPPPLRVQLDLLARLELSGSHFFHLVCQQVDAPRPLALVLAQALQFAAHRAYPAHQLTHPRGLVGQPCITVQQTGVLALAQQRQVLALAVDIHEQPGNLAQKGGGDGTAVDARD